MAQWGGRAERDVHPLRRGAGIHPQDDASSTASLGLRRARQPSSYPLLLHYHPLVIYRHQVIKQADVVLAMFLLGDQFTAEEKRWTSSTTTRSPPATLRCRSRIQAIAAADAGKYRTAEEYLVDAVAVDMADTAGNLRDSADVASAGGAWMAVVYGFAGYRWRSGPGVRTDPADPGRRVRFPLTAPRARPSKSTSRSTR